MDVQLTPDQEAFVRQGIERGEFNHPADAVRAALRLWEERERSRAEIRAAFDEAEADLASGRYRDYSDETLPGLAEEIKREARAQRQRR